MEKEQPGGEITTIWNKNFISVMIANFMLCLAHSAVNPLVATYTKHLGAGARLTGLITGMFFGIALAMRPVAGPATTKLDKRKLLIFVFALGSIASTGYAIFHSVPAFVAFRFLNGVQYSLVGSLLITLAGDNLPKDRMASGIGIYGISGATGMAIAPAIGNSILEFGTARKNADFGFTLTFTFAAVILALAVVAATLISSDKKTKEQNASTGAWYKNIFTKHAIPTTVALFLLMVPYSLYNTYIIEFARERGIESISAFYTVLALTMAVSRPMSGVLTDKFGVQRVMFPALALFGVSFIIVGNATALVTVLIGAGIGAIGYGAAQPSLQAMCMQSETSLRRGVASNTIYIGIDLALFMGPIFGSIVYDIFDYSVMFKAAVIPIVIAMVFFAAIMPVYKRRLAELEAMEGSIRK